MRIRSLILFLFLAGLPLAAGRAQNTGLLVVAHGADSGWNDRVAAVVEQVRWTGPVELAYLMGDASHDGHGWNDAVARLEAKGIDRLVVVPLMVSSHGAHTRQIQFYAGALAQLPSELSGHVHGPVSHPRVTTMVTDAIDAAPELGAVLLDHWRALPAADRARPVVLVAHGPSGDVDARRWESALSVANAPLAAALGNAPMRIGLIRDDAPPAERAAAVASIRDTIAALASASGDSVLVMTVLISSSGINTVRIPADLAGTPMRYAGVSLAPHPALARWIERMASAAA